VLGNPDVFLNTIGDIHLLAKVLQVADNYDTRPNNKIMNADLKKYDIESLFKGNEI
jgi:hypothetical protein